MKLSRLIKKVKVSITSDPRKEVVRVAVGDGHKIAFPQYSLPAIAELLKELADSLGFEAIITQKETNEKTDELYLTINLS